MTALTWAEARALDVLAEGRTTRSAVALAADLYGRGLDSHFDAGDIVGFVTMVVDSLCEKGLLVYRTRLVGTDIPQDIRLTQEGWEQAGYPRMTVEVGSRSRHSALPKRTTDFTDYKNQQFRATGTDIEKEDLLGHTLRYPHHPEHIRQLQEVNLMHAQRTYTRVTPDLEAAVITAKERLGPMSTYADVAEEAGVTTRQVRYILGQLPELRRMRDGDTKAEGSLKERILSCLIAIPEGFATATDLRRALGRADDTHNIVHVLHALRKQGRVSFDSRGGEKGEPKNIKWVEPKRQNGVEAANKVMEKAVLDMGMDVENAEVQPADAEEEADHEWPIPVTADETSAVRVFPALAELRAREAKRRTGDSKAEAYMAAAEAVKDIDPEQAGILMQKANDHMAIPLPSPVESEYLRLADMLWDAVGRGYQPMYNGRPTCPFCDNFVDEEETHKPDCLLLAVTR